MRSFEHDLHCERRGSFLRARALPLATTVFCLSVVVASGAFSSPRGAQAEIPQDREALYQQLFAADKLIEKSLPPVHGRVVIRAAL